MNSAPVTWDGRSRSLIEQEQTTQYSGPQKALTTLALLALGYYALHFFDAWPSTIQRSVYEITIYLIPSHAIYLLQRVIMRYGRVPEDAIRFQKADFGNSHAKAEAIQRILGQTSFPTALRKARSLSGIEAMLPSNKEPGPPGLGNWDNSCYQNSILQGLASLPAFLEYIEKSLCLCDRLEVSASTHRALRLFLAELSDTSRRQTTVWTPTVLKSMDSWQQQDAQEYFSRVTEAVEKEAIRCSVALQRRISTGLESLVHKRNAEDEPVGMLRRFSLDESAFDTSFKTPNKSSRIPENQESIRSSVRRGLLNSLPKNPMDGTQSQSLKCQACGFSEGATLTPFSCLTLNLGLRGPSYLEDLIDDFTEPEIVEDVECTECTKAVADGKLDQHESKENDVDQDRPSPSKRPKLKPVLRDKAKQITLCRLPKDLVLHINRSIFNDWGEQRKNGSPIQFPARLEFLDRWCMPLAAEEDRPEAMAIYELRCAVMHHGRHENGHYVAFAKRDKDWYCFNDEIVTRVNEVDVLSRGNVFMLFYEAVNDARTAIGSPQAVHSTETQQHIQTTVSAEQHESSSNSSDSDGAQEAEPITRVQPVPALRTASGSVRSLESASRVVPPAVPAL